MVEESLSIQMEHTIKDNLRMTKCKEWVLYTIVKGNLHIKGSGCKINFMGKVFFIIKALFN